MLRSIEVARYDAPLRDGSSPPAELVAGEMGRAFGLPVPAPVLATLLVRR